MKEGKLTIDTDQESQVSGSTQQCPFCGISPVVDDICPGSCGSLEGMMMMEMPELMHKSRTFGFDWANGYVAPILGIHESAVQEAFGSARLDSEDTVVDLGCGDGRICHLASAMDAARAVGYDLDESLLAIAKETNAINTSFYIGNLFEVDLEPFSIITMFLLPETTDKLVSKLQQALVSRPNQRIIAFGWPIPGLGSAVDSYTNKTGSLLDKWYLYANKNNQEFLTINGNQTIE